MDLQSLASREATALLTELLGGQAGAALQQLEQVREALDGAARALARPEVADDRVQALAGRLAEAADAELRRVRDEAAIAVNAMRGELEAAQAERQKGAAALVTAESELTTVRRELHATQERARATQQDLTIALDAHAKLEASLRKLEADWQQAAHAKASLEADLSQAHTTIQQLLADVEQQRTQLDALAAEKAALTGELASAREAYDQRAAAVAELETALARLQTLEAEISRNAEARARLEGELEQATQARQQSGAALETAQARVQELEHELATAREIRAQRDALAADLHASGTRIRALEVELAMAGKIAEQRDTLAADLEVTRRRILSLETDLAKTGELREHRNALTSQLAAGQARIQALESELARANNLAHQRDAAAGQLEAALQRIAALERDLANAALARQQQQAVAADAGAARIAALEQEIAAAREVRDERDRFALQLQKVNAHVHALEKERATARDVRDERDRFALQLEKDSSRITVLENELGAARELLARWSDGGPAGPVAAAPAGSADQLRADFDRMVSLFEASTRAVDELAAVNDSSELLTELVGRLGAQFPRVALFRVKGNRLVGERQCGFDESTNMSKLIIPISVDSILSRAVAAGTCLSLSGEDVAARAGLPFRGSPASAVALPIAIQGTTLAVVYADDAGAPESARGPVVHEANVGYARLLVGQTVALLVRHTHELKTLAELSQYATTLLQEAKEIYRADTQAGKTPDVVRSRLKDNIECANQLYACRAAMEGTAAAVLLDQQIVAELQESTPFAEDLAAVLGELARKDLEITAEAS